MKKHKQCDCGVVLTGEARFCEACGKPVNIIAAPPPPPGTKNLSANATCACGASIIKSARFCENCGKPVQEKLKIEEKKNQIILPLPVGIKKAPATPPPLKKVLKINAICACGASITGATRFCETCGRPATHIPPIPPRKVQRTATMAVPVKKPRQHTRALIMAAAAVVLIIGGFFLISNLEFSEKKRAGLLSQPDDDPIYKPGKPASSTTQFETNRLSVAAGTEAKVSLKDGTNVTLPALPVATEVTLERDNNDLSLTNESFITTGSMRRLVVSGLENTEDLLPTLSIPLTEAGSINLETVMVLRVGDIVMNGEIIKDHQAFLPVFIDAAGNLGFVDHYMQFGSLESSHSNVLGDPKHLNALAKAGWGGSFDHLFSTFTSQLNLFGTKAFAASPLLMASATAANAAATSSQTRARYVMMSFENHMNWSRQAHLIRMIPDPEKAETGYRRPAKTEELVELAKTPICNIVILVHGHNEEEKEGSSQDMSEVMPWFFLYKRLVWDIFYQQVIVMERENEEFPLECTAFYEFIYPTYRPIFSPVQQKNFRLHETLGQAMGRAIEHELSANPQLKAMMDHDMDFNVSIVAHSMGGLVGRAGLMHMPQKFKDNIVRFISWGSPHHGAAMYSFRIALDNANLRDNAATLFSSGASVGASVGGIKGAAIGGGGAIIGAAVIGHYLNKLVLDAPGIRDMQWDNGQKHLVIPLLNKEGRNIPIFSENLQAFNQRSAASLSSGGYSLFTGNTSKITNLTGFPTASGIAQGALLNSVLMKDESHKISDGAVPIHSQGAYGIGLIAPEGVKRINMGDMDHEEFYGAEPKQRTAEAIHKGVATARKTIEEAALKHSRSSCPTIEAKAENDGEDVVIKGELIFPVYAAENRGSGKAGNAIKKIEVKRYTAKGRVIKSTNTINKDGTFECRIKAGDGRGGDRANRVLLVTLKDGSILEAEPEPEVRVYINPPRSITYDMAGSEHDELFREFEAHARPDTTYRYDWDFDDGETFSEVVEMGNKSKASHTYTNLKPGDVFRPSVKLFDMDGKLLNQDIVEIKFEEVETDILFGIWEGREGLTKLKFVYQIGPPEEYGYDYTLTILVWAECPTDKECWGGAPAKIHASKEMVQLPDGQHAVDFGPFAFTNISLIIESDDEIISPFQNMSMKRR